MLAEGIGLPEELASPVERKKLPGCCYGLRRCRCTVAVLGHEKWVQHGGGGGAVCGGKRRKIMMGFGLD